MPVSTAGEPGYLHDLLSEAAMAVAGAAPFFAASSRRRLARRVLGTPSFIYHVPQVVIDYALEATDVVEDGWLWASKKSEETLESRFRLRFISTAGELRPLASADSELTFSLPPFLASEPGQVRVAVDDLIQYLVSISPSWQGIDGLRKKLRKAARYLKGSEKKMHWEEALVFHTGVDRRLLCLIDEKKNGSEDGVFELAGEPGGAVSVLAVTYPGDGTPERYPLAPLYRFLLAVRRWQVRQGRAVFELPSTARARGLDFRGEILSILGEVIEAHRKARLSLGAAGYRIGRWHGELRATLDQTGRILFKRRRGQLENTVELTVEERDGRLFGRARLGLPEFILGGAERARVLDAVAGDPDLRRELERGDARGQRSRASVFLSLRQRKNILKRGYLVIWPGTFDGEQRDFIVHVKLRRKRPGVKEADKVLTFEEQMSGLAAESRMAEFYNAFHHVFNAVAVWYSRFR